MGGQEKEHEKQSQSQDETRLTAFLLLLIRHSAPFHADIVRQMLVRDFLKYGQGVSGTYTIGRLTADSRGIVHIEPLDRSRACSVMRVSQGIDRNHCPAGTLHEEEVQVVRMGTIWRICLDINTIDTVIHIEVIHVDRSRESLERREHIGH